jgi:hypothetical protein
MTIADRIKELYKISKEDNDLISEKSKDKLDKVLIQHRLFKASTDNYILTIDILGDFVLEIEKNFDKLIIWFSSDLSEDMVQCLYIYNSDKIFKTQLNLNTLCSSVLGSIIENTGLKFKTGDKVEYEINDVKHQGMYYGSSQTMVLLLDEKCNILAAPISTKIKLI